MMALRAQSAMEYLMTYGWSILIIAISLATLFSLGFFSNLGGPANACVPLAPYTCYDAVVAPYNNLATGQITGPAFSGQFKAIVGQNAGVNVYNAFFTVASQSSQLNSMGYPITVNVFPLCTGNCGINLPPGATNTIYVLLNANELPVNTLSKSFSGQIWMNYSSVPGGAARQSIKVALFDLKIT